jgi:hypothetical protein
MNNGSQQSISYNKPQFIETRVEQRTRKMISSHPGASLLLWQLAFAAAIFEYDRGIVTQVAAFSPSSSASRTIFGQRSISTAATTTTSIPSKRYSSVGILDGNIRPAIITKSRPKNLVIPKSSRHDVAAATTTSPSVVLTKNNDVSSATMDSISLGTLTVPSIGIGTISWSSDKRTYTENCCFYIETCMCDLKLSSFSRIYVLFWHSFNYEQYLGLKTPSFKLSQTWQLLTMQPFWIRRNAMDLT